jgi:hypothetical protein
MKTAVAMVVVDSMIKIMEAQGWMNELCIE